MYDQAKGQLKLSLDDAQSTYTLQNGNVDYFRDVPIKTNLRRNFADGSLYDRDLSEGDFNKVIKKLRTRFPQPSDKDEPI